MRRWRNWLRGRGDAFALFLRSRCAEFGRFADCQSCWRNVIYTLSLEQAMALLDRDLVVP